jgi:hypothetical protein
MSYFADCINECIVMWPINITIPWHKRVDKYKEQRNPLQLNKPIGEYKTEVYVNTSLITNDAQIKRKDVNILAAYSDHTEVERKKTIEPNTKPPEPDFGWETNQTDHTGDTSDTDGQTNQTDYTSETPDTSTSTTGNSNSDSSGQGGQNDYTGITTDSSTTVTDNSNTESSGWGR